MADVDVAVIGAGAAGIAAAEVLLAAGLSVQVLEARDRPGGRAFTDQVAGIPFDAGAAYVQFHDRNPWVAIAERLGVVLEGHRGFGRGIPFRGGERLGEDERQARIAARERLHEIMEAAEAITEDRSFAELLAGEAEPVREMGRRYCTQALGEDPQRVSALDACTLWEGPDLVVPQGYGTLVAAAAAGLPIAYGRPVTALRWGGGGVEVETASGTLRARQAIVTVPLGVLAAEAIRFDPVLPAATRDAIAGLPMGALSKVALAFDGERFGWPSPSDAFSVDSGLNFEFWPFGRDIVVATFGGDFARGIVEVGEAAAVAFVMERLVEILGGQARQHWLGGRLSGWWSDPWSRGGYAVALPGHREARLALARPVAGKLWLAGEATGGEGEAVAAAMTVGGATLAGRAAARGVIAAGR
jgi:monoamine oxidase